MPINFIAICQGIIEYCGCLKENKTQVNFSSPWKSA